MRYIITGHKGQIGINLKEKLDNLGHTCILSVDLKEGQNMANLSTRGLKADMFYHLASFCKIRDTVYNPELSHIDATSTFRALEMCRQNNIPHFIYFSSVRVLSDNHTPYSACKKYGEELVKAYCECYGLKYIIIRPSSVYGGKDETGRLIQIWIDAAKKGEDLVIYGDKDKSLNFTYIDDFLEGVFDITTKPMNAEYNICGDSRKLIDVANEIIKQLDSKSKVVYQLAEPWQPQVGDLKPTNNKINIEEGIKCLI